MRRSVVVAALLAAAVLAFSCGGGGIPDSPAARTARARDFLKTVDLAAMMDALAGGYAAAWTAARRDAFRDFVRREVRWTQLEEAMVTALAAHFSAAEIQALAEFQSSAAGRSLIQKLPAYQADLVPAFEAEFNRVAAAAEFGRTTLVWETAVREATAGPAEATLLAEFPFVNRGSRPVALATITTSCGCTVARPEKTVFQPGERGSIRAVYTVGGRVGLQDERIVVTTDEPEKPSVTLRLRVMIPEVLKIAPLLLSWRADEGTRMKTVVLDVPAGRDTEILGVEAVPEGFAAKTVLDKASQIYLVHLTPRTTARPLAAQFMVLAASSRGGTVFRFPVYLRVFPRDEAPKDGDRPWENILWIDAQGAAGYSLSHLPGALPLTLDDWDRQIEPVLASWRPGRRVVVYCRPPCSSGQVVERLRRYGLDGLYVLAGED